MATQFIIVDRLTGDLFGDNKIKRFYDTVSAAQGQMGWRHLWTMLEVTLGENPKIEPVAKYSITEKEFADSIDKQLEETQFYMDKLLAEKDKTIDWPTLHRSGQERIKKYRETIIMLNSLRYENLLYK